MKDYFLRDGGKLKKIGIKKLVRPSAPKVLKIPQTNKKEWVQF